MSETSTKAGSETQSVRKFKWRRYLAFLAIFVVLLYLLSLVLLNTSWAKDKITSRLSQKSNSDWEVGNILWMPFGDIELNDVQTTMGEGGVKIETLRVTPSWSELISGKLDLKGASATEAEIDLDLKWLKENLSNNNDILEVEQPSVIAKPRPQPQPVPQVNPNPPKPVQPNTGKPPVKPQPKPAVADEPKFNNIPNRWLKLKKINLTIRNGDKIIDKVSDISASIPYAGKPAEGDIKFTFQGSEHIQKISWDGKELSAEETSGKNFNVSYQWRAGSKISQPGMPFVFRFIVPKQKLSYTLDKPNLHVHVASETIAANFMLNGSLRSTKTWRGIFGAGTSKITVIENQKTHKRLEFDHTRMMGTISNGVISIPAAEAVGHKLSILGNGKVHKNLYSYGVVRLIANDEAYKTFERVYHATKIIHIRKKKAYHLLLPLGTPDRTYCDIHLDGKLTNLQMRHNHSDRWQPLNLALKKLLKFKNEELQEDGLLEDSN